MKGNIVALDIHYIVSQDFPAGLFHLFHVVKWEGPTPLASYLVGIGGGYHCSCPGFMSHKRCKHIKMVKRFRQAKYAAQCYNKDITKLRITWDDKKQKISTKVTVHREEVTR